MSDSTLLAPGDRGDGTAPADRPVEAVLLVDDGSRWLRLSNPKAVLTARTAADVSGVLCEAEKAARRGGHAVGWVAYDAAAAYDLPVLPGRCDFPLAAFALYDAHAVRTGEPPCATHPYSVSGPVPSCAWEAYAEAFERVKAHIADGDSYQVNGTFDLRAAFAGDPRALLCDLARTQRGRYAAYLRFGDWSICSGSPELFFRRHGTTLSTRPMKGTAPRGRTMREDRAVADRLRTSAKERAENVMVVDMMRNDLGRIARVGSVHVPRLFSVERYPTVWQMTSEVNAESGAPLPEIFAALFPSASVTGAPKVRTMEIIRAFEGRPRGLYTGAIGYLAPGGDAQFSVAIRTAVIDHRDSSLTFGVGSGIVWDSDARAEYEECLLKGAVLGLSDESFALLETLAWIPGDGYACLPEHMDRLRQSAEYFAYRMDDEAVRRALAAAVTRRDRSWRVRLLLDEAGRVRTESFPLELRSTAVRACVSPDPIESSNTFLYHKTTRREAYDARICPHCDDVILQNDRGEITESTRANVIVELNGQLLTPPVSSGLLPGTFRARLLRTGEVREQVIRGRHLAAASRLWLVNSVHGWQPADLQQH